MVSIDAYGCFLGNNRVDALYVSSTSSTGEMEPSPTHFCMNLRLLETWWQASLRKNWLISRIS